MSIKRYVDMIFRCTLLTVLLFAFPGPSSGKTITGNTNLFLYQSGTGSPSGGVNNIEATAGDRILIDVYARNPQNEEITGMDLSLTVPADYFDIVSQDENVYGHPMPFIQGNFMSPANATLLEIKGNWTNGDTLTANDNNIKDWQLDYEELAQTSGQYSSLTYGIVCTFELIAKAPCQSAQIKLDWDSPNDRKSRYFVNGLLNVSNRFNNFISCTISVTGFQIEPPFPDIVLQPGESDSSLNLDNHINVDPASLSWSASGNNKISVVIDPMTKIVTFTAPEGFKGYEDITFTGTTITDGVKASDTIRVSVDAIPEFTTAIPDTIYIHEDSLGFAFDQRDIVQDADDPFEALTLTYEPGANLTHSFVADSLYLKGELNFNGIDVLKISVKDSIGLSDSLTVPVNVLAVNDIPVLKDFPDEIIERGDTYQFSINDYATDVDGDTLTVTWEMPDNFEITAADTLIAIRGVQSFLGSEDIIFTVTDPGNLAVTDTMTVTVIPALKPPVWSRIPKVGFAQNSADSSLVLWDYVSDPDDADSFLTFEITNDEDIDQVLVNYRNGKLYLYDTDNKPGWDRLTITATDPDGNSAVTQFLAFVAYADGRPIVGGIPDTTVVAEVQADWIDLDDYYYDIDNTDSQMKWTWGSQANPDSSVTILINQFSHQVRLIGIDENRFGKNMIFFTVTDPGGKYGDDLCEITVLKELNKPFLNLRRTASELIIM